MDLFLPTNSAYACYNARTMTQEQALHVLKLGHNVFLTGAAGTGKTYVLNQFIEYCRTHGLRVAITASTGIAATHMNGQTIHSWSGMGLEQELTDSLWKKVMGRKEIRSRIAKCHVLIIDEISMLHHYRLDMLDTIARRIRRRDEAFGGIQVIMSGDFFQLPPVSRRGEPDAQFAVFSDAWRAAKPRICYLQKQYRQKDDSLHDLLTEMRNGEVSEFSRQALQSRVGVELSGSTFATQLYTVNADVDSKNQEHLDSIKGKPKKFTMESRGDRDLVEKLKNGCMSPETLELKKGAIVMFVRNSAERGFVNGTQGEVVGFSDNGYPKVRMTHGPTITVYQEEWQIAEEDRTVAAISQLPLRLAWAITVHKSQGMSLDAAQIDLRKSFVEGMGYVALSRLRSLAGMKLLGLNEMALQVDRVSLAIDHQLQEASRKVSDQVASFSDETLEQLQRRRVEGLKLRMG